MAFISYHHKWLSGHQTERIFWRWYQSFYCFHLRGAPSIPGNCNQTINNNIFTNCYSQSKSGIIRYISVKEVSALCVCHIILIVRSVPLIAAMIDISGSAIVAIIIIWSVLPIFFGSASLPLISSRKWCDSGGKEKYYIRHLYETNP